MNHDEIEDMQDLLLLLKANPGAARAYRRLSRSANIAWSALHESRAALQSPLHGYQERIDAAIGLMHDATVAARNIPYE